MKKKVYEKQLSQLRASTESKRGGVSGPKSKVKKTTISKQDIRASHSKTQKAASAEKERKKEAASSIPAPKVIEPLPKVDVLIKRRVVEPQSTGPQPTTPRDRTISTLSSDECTKNDTAFPTTVELCHSATTSHSTGQEPVDSPLSLDGTQENDGSNSESPKVTSSDAKLCTSADSSSEPYRVDLNNSIENMGMTDESVNETGVLCVGSSRTSDALSTEESYRYGVTLTSDQNVPSLHDSQPYTASGVSHKNAMTRSAHYGTTDGQVVIKNDLPMVNGDPYLASTAPSMCSVSAPVSLVSAPQLLPSRGHYTVEGSAHFPPQSREYALQHHHQNAPSPDLHTLRPMAFPTNGCQDETARGDHYGSTYTDHVTAAWDQESNRYTDYSHWHPLHAHGANYISKNDVYTHDKPYTPNGYNSHKVNGVNTISEVVDNNNDVNISNHNNKAKYPYPSGLLGDKDMEMYSSDDSSSAKVSVGSSGRRRRKRVQTPVQRSAANMRERRRMCHLNVAFDYLKEHLPNVKDKKKLSRIQTLKAAIYYIHLLRDSLEMK